MTTETVTLTTDPEEYAKVWLETPFAAICLKEHPEHGTWNKHYHGAESMVARKYGRLSSPAIRQGQVHNQTQTNELILAHKGEVIVIGHPDDRFVWRGSPQDFIEWWLVD